jgi:hypothetical protein
LRTNDFGSKCPDEVGIIDNQEDSIIMNQSAIDRGLFSSTCYRTFSEYEKKCGMYVEESICIPPETTKIKMGQPGYFRRKNGNYSLLDEHGVVRKGVPVNKGDIIVGKIITKTSKTGVETRTDCSLAIKAGEEGIVDRAEVYKNPNGYKLVKITIRKQKIPEMGDKFACYTPDHEVLTTTGWITIDKLTKDHKVACMIDKQKLEYHFPSDIQSYDYNNKMYTVESDKVSLCVTPNHRMYTGNCHRKNYDIRTADEIYGKMRSYQNNIDKWIPPEMKTFTLPAYEELPTLDLELEAWCLLFGIWIA